MTILTQKKKLSQKTVCTLFCAALYLFLVLFLIGLFLFNSNYAAVYDSPQVIRGRADFSDTDLPPRSVACNLAGEWEFFYNKWIVTDGYDGEPDGLIKIPQLWTYKNFGEGALPRTGYASYRLIADNVQPDVDIYVFRYYCNFAFRVYVNGELNYSSGTLSKNPDETVAMSDTDEKHPYRTDGGPLEIVIEISATRSGGFTAAPWLASTSAGNSYGLSLRSFNYIALGVTTAATIVSVLSFLFFRYKRDLTVPAFMLALYAHFLSSKDMLYYVNVPMKVALPCSLFTAIAAFVILALHFWRSGAAFCKKFVLPASLSAALFTVLFIAFYGTPLAPAFAFLLFGTGCACLVPIVCNNKFATIQRGVYGVLTVFLMSVFCFELCDGLGLLVFGTEFIFSFELMLIIACFAVLWLWKLAKSARDAIRVSELECELSSVKTQALKAQIEPHFVYNSLTAIQARYRDGLVEGDRAIEQFARHLRLITDSNGKDIIPFDDEVRNVLNYFELENLRASGKLNLLLDLNVTDFCVPVLSLQPLVENAVRHGGLRERADGFVQLSSEKTEREITVTVSDNGKGFDPNTAHEGVGIENTRKRLELMNATLSVESETGAGTRATIRIPLE